MWDKYRLGDCIKACMDCEKSMLRGGQGRGGYLDLLNRYNLTGLVVHGESLHTLKIRTYPESPIQQQHQQQEQPPLPSPSESAPLYKYNMNNATNFGGRYFWGHCIHQLSYLDQQVKPSTMLNHSTFVRENLFVWAAQQQHQQRKLPQEQRNRQQQQQQLQGQQQRYQEGAGYEFPPSNAIVLHLRLGDVIERSRDSVVKMLYRGGNPAHHITFANSIKNLSEYLDNIREADQQYALLTSRTTVEGGWGNGTTPLPTAATVKVVIRGGGSHISHHYRKSRRYVTCLKKEAIIEAGYPDVEMVLDGQNPDQDFFYMSHSRYFVSSVGGYSMLIGQMVQLLGGTIIGRVVEKDAPPQR
jgi:hypothetical protein